MLNLQIIGYYEHKNIGDEQYKLSFESLFLKLFRNSDIIYKLDFHDCDKINNIEFHEDDIIILGGGDILNEYFLDKIIAKFQGTTNKIIAISVGLPYKSVLTETSKLNIIDYIFLRTKQDLDLFQKYFHPHRIMYLPDISFELVLDIPKPLENTIKYKKNINESSFSRKSSISTITSLSSTTSLSNISSFTIIYDKMRKIKNSKKKIVCLSLNRHICKSKNYESIINNFTQFIKFLTNFDYHVVFIPFNTNENNPNENDILIHNDIIEKYKKSTWSSDRYKTHLTNINFELTVDQILLLFNLIDINVPMRFHACLFSIYKNVLFFPIFTTRKIRNLLVDIDWMYGYELDTDSKDLPKSLNLNILINRFMTMLSSMTNVYSNNDLTFRTLKQKLEYINLNIFGKEYNNNYDTLKDIILTKIKDRNNSVISEIDEKIIDIYNSVQEFAKLYKYDDFRKINDEYLKDIIVSIVSYNLTNGCIISKYNYGLKEKMFNINYNYFQEWKWIYQNEENVHKVNKLLSNSHGIFDIGFVDQEDYSGCHRSGWQYVYENIKYLHNDKSNLLFDLYIDRTFHWNKEVNKALKLIPYKKNWIGVIHHTFDTSFSDFNCHKLLETSEFLESLHYCKALIVLSKYLALKLKDELNKLNFHDIKVVYMTHPTDHNVNKFTLNKFLENKDKKLIHVGGWVRNIYSFYNLTIPQTSFRNGIINITQHDFKLRKVALKGKNMNNYYPFNDFSENLFNALITQKNFSKITEKDLGNISNVGNVSSSLQMISCNVSCDNVISDKKITNNWYKHFYEDILTKIKTVDILEYTNNEEYDKLLEENIIFINLVDASAVNTVIECIVRNTPIIVNKHPAIIEMLGEEYPLYYDNDSDETINNQIKKLLENGNKIRKAHNYLSRMNKNRYMIQNFVFALIRLVFDLSRV